MKKPSRGFTMLELLVVIAIIGVLLAWTTAGVHSARVAARRLDCSNRLRQLGLAVCAYADNFGATPAFARNDSPWLKLPAFLGINTDGVELVRNVPYDEPYYPRSLHAGIATALAPRVQCPAMTAQSYLEPVIAGGLPTHAHLAVSYVANVGSEITMGNGDWGGAFAWQGVRWANVKDGLSKTAMVSEVVVTADADQSRASGRNDVGVILAGPITLDDLVAACRGTPPLGHLALIGKQFAFADSSNTLYSHTTAPGGFSCENDSSPSHAFVSAGSEHGDMVNLLLCDGSVQQYGYSVDLRIWKALGTRAGGDEF